MGYIKILITKLQSLKASNKKKYTCSESQNPNSNSLANQKESIFVNLAPTDKADEKGIYYRALKKATSDKKVRNIALTGPYGSGKSSIIQTFLTKYEGSELEISLAAFIPDKSSDSGSGDDEVARKDIERSILQQMLYEVDANKLPLSRFNRIQSPTRLAPLVSLFGLLGFFATGYLLSKISMVFNGELLKPVEIAKWFDYLMLALSGTFLWLLAHKIYLQTFGISLKSISLKNIELAPSAKDETSVLNKHLDEIIYFFQKTDYNLVIFEDLDRFNDPSIFVTLREINSLINKNAGVGRDIQFLYALRDDIFLNTERTKFFESIIPVIPVINHSNSIDKVLELVKEQELTEKLDKRFLGEVSRYLTDMRLIISIFHEHAIYSESLADKDLNPNKLLAVLIYKNVFPWDFEDLHHQRGVLIDVIEKYDESVLQTEKDCKDRILALETEIEEINQEIPENLHELTRIYAMGIVEVLPNRLPFISYDGNPGVSIKELSTYEDFENLIVSKNVSEGHYQGSHFSKVDISSVQTAVDPKNTYSQRKEKILQKAAKGQKRLNMEMRKLKEEAASVRQQRFHEVLQANQSQIMQVISKAGENAALLQYLIFEGYLDDTYYLYVSLFHEGRMSLRDNGFLNSIRGYKTPNPEFKIDNPREVISSMRDEDFSRSYVLNHTLIDFLVENSETHSEQLRSALTYVSEKFDHCSDFFSSYYINGKQANTFVGLLAKQWPGFALTALDSSSAADHIARILANAPSDLISNSLNEDQAITEFLSAVGYQVFDQRIEFNLEILTALEVKVTELSSIKKHTKLIDYLVKNSLYALTFDNISFLITEGDTPQKSKQLETSNLTAILQSENKELISYVKENYETYLEEVFFAIGTNTKESLSTLKELLSESGITTETKERILEYQDTVFPSFESVPAEFYSNLLQHRTIEPNWDNLILYLSSEASDRNILTQYLQDSDVQGKLQSSVLSDAEEALNLCWFIFNNDEFDTDEYQTYIQILPNTFKGLPDSVSDEKKLVAIKANKVNLNEESFESLEYLPSLLAALLTANIEEYLDDKELYEIDDNVREFMINSDISNQSKYSIITDLDDHSVIENTGLAIMISRVLLSATEFRHDDFSYDFHLSVIENAETTKAKILLINKCQPNWTKGHIGLAIGHLPEPYSKIGTLGLAPKIPNSPENLIFAKWLEEQEYVSTTSVKGKDIHINNFNKPRY